MQNYCMLIPMLQAQSPPTYLFSGYMKVLVGYSKIKGFWDKIQKNTVEGADNYQGTTPKNKDISNSWFCIG